MKNIVDYSEFVLLIERGGGGDSFFDKIKNMGSTLKKFIRGKAVLKRAMSMYKNGAMREISLYKKYSEEILTAELEKEHLEDKYRGSDVEANEYSIKMKELRSNINIRLEGMQEKMKAEVEKIYSKVEGYISNNSDNLGSYETNLLNSKKNLLASYVKIKKMKIDEQKYIKLNKEKMSDKIKDKIKKELDIYKDKVNKSKKHEDDYNERESNLSINLKQKNTKKPHVQIEIEEDSVLKDDIEKLKQKINSIKDTYKGVDGKVVKDNVSIADKERLKELISQKNKKEYMFLRDIPEHERTESQQKKYSNLVLKMRK